MQCGSTTPSPSVCILRTRHLNPTTGNHPGLSSMSYMRFTQFQYNINGARTLTTVTSHVLSTSMPIVICTATSASLDVGAHLTPSNLPQRSEEWFALRKDKLTTSTFSSALGFWKGNRRAALWREKVFLPEIESVTARSAMEWGVRNETPAIERYKTITGRDVDVLGFATHADVRFGWLGASPDGLLGCCPGGGILEVKCPYNKGKPEVGLPWATVPYYYMPQVQGQMEIMDRDWVDLYCWTINGSTLFRVVRDRGYWELIHGILRDFWWECVVPAKEALALGGEADAMRYEPPAKHRQTGLVIAKSLRLSDDAKLICKEIGGHVEFFL